MYAVWVFFFKQKTAYDIRIDDVKFNSERDAAQESLFNAQPSLTANRASNWAPEAMRYDAEGFNQALLHMLRAAPELRTSEPNQYDLEDIADRPLPTERRGPLPLTKAPNEGEE